VAVLLVFLLFAVLQIAALFYVRSIVAASAADGARYAVNADVGPDAGAARATAQIRDGLNDRIAADVPCTGSVSIDPVSGLRLTSVRCTGSIHSLLLPFAALIGIDVRSRSLEEGP
jgi:hypothetical protein